ncbi:MAG: DUF3352 domain-containing protein, partial [Solirubrobacterales bacterium]
MRRRATIRGGLAATLALGAAGLVACGGNDLPGPDPATVTPDDAQIFVDAVHPGSEETDEAREALGILTGNDDPGGFVIEQLDELLADQGTGVTYEADIEPWLGERAGLYVGELSDGSDPDVGLMVAVTDEGAAQETVDKLNEAGDAVTTEEEYEGVSYSLSDEDMAVGFVDDFLVVGTRNAFEATVDASTGDPLADDEDYSELVGQADGDRLVTAYVEARSLLMDAVTAGAAEEADVMGFLELLPENGSIVAWGAATADAVTVELTSAAGDDPTDGGSELL